MLYNVIVAYDLERGIGFNNQIPWKFTNDLKRVKDITTQPGVNCLIMGRKTYESIPAKFRPLPSRYNIILSKSSNFKPENDSVFVCSSFDKVDEVLSDLSKKGLTETFFFGGQDIYSQAIQRYTINKYYLTQIMQKYKCDAFFPKVSFNGYTLTESKCDMDIKNNVVGRYQVYKRNEQNDTVVLPNDTEYQNLLSKIITTGKYCDDRTGVGTLSIFAQNLTFDISEFFPLLTIKRVFFRGVAEELFLFFSGKTTAKILQDKNIHIWDGNSSREYLDSIGQKHRKVGDLGKFYGFQWRHWGASYTDCDQNYDGKGFDQIQMLIDLIKNSPTSRRILLTAWNPADLKDTALPPCHVLYQFYVDVEERTLSCLMTQRSVDTAVGLPFNIASSALFTYLLAKTCDLKPAKLTISMGDTHCYLNHIPQVMELIKNKPKTFPKLNIKIKKDKLEDYTFDDLELIGYDPHGKIKMVMN